jgi:hypothetical protein
MEYSIWVGHNKFEIGKCYQSAFYYLEEAAFDKIVNSIQI